MIIMETERLILRYMNQDDLDALCKIMCDIDVMHAAYENAFTRDETEAWLHRHLKRYETLGYGLFAVCLKDTSEMIGQCGLTWQNWNGKELLEIGYLFQKAFWHKGFALEAAKACKAYAFNHLNVSQVYSMVRDTNTSARKVAERNGMKLLEMDTKNFRSVDMNFCLYGIDKDFL